MVVLLGYCEPGACAAARAPPQKACQLSEACGRTRVIARARSAGFDPKRLSRSVSLNLDDHLDFNGIVEGKSRHPYGRACVLSRLAEHVHHQIGKSVYYLWLVTKIIGGVDHPKDLYDALHVIQAADCGSHFRQHD